MQQLYTKRALIYEKWYVNRLGWGRELDAFFRKYDYLQPSFKVLDAGCGTGIITRTLYNIVNEKGYEGLEFHAFDLTQNMLDIFQEQITEQRLKNIKLAQADALKLYSLPSSWGEYDLIVSSALLEYIPEEQISNALINLKQLLKAGGRLLIFVTKRNLITTWTGKFFWKTNLFEEEKMQRILQDAGFNKINQIKLPSKWSKHIMAIEAGL